MRLADLVHPAFRLIDQHGTTNLDGLAAAASPLARGTVFEVPAADPRAALIGLESAWMAGAVPLPSARCSAPRDLGPSDDSALVLRTSGSTGTPRLPTFTAAAVMTAARRIASYLTLSADDTVALLLPCDHGFGLVGQLLAAASVGATVVWCGRPFPAERAQAIVDARATVVAAVPYGLTQLAEHLAPQPQIRQVGSAGGPLLPHVASRLALAFPAAVLWNQYGCTEAGPRLAAIPSTSPAFASGTVGRPIAGVKLWVDAPEPRAPGAICFASDTAMRGYLGAPEATEAARRTAPDGTRGFTTGDVGVLDEADRLHVVGRVDDLVKLRGERVSLDAVARAAERAGADAALAIVAGDDTLVVVYEGPNELRASALVRELPSGIAPRRMLKLPALPRLASGKLDRTAIDALARGGPQ